MTHSFEHANDDLSIYCQGKENLKLSYTNLDLTQNSGSSLSRCLKLTHRFLQLNIGFRKAFNHRACGMLWWLRMLPFFFGRQIKSVSILWCSPDKISWIHLTVWWRQLNQTEITWFHVRRRYLSHFYLLLFFFSQCLANKINV